LAHHRNRTDLNAYVSSRLRFERALSGEQEIDEWMKVRLANITDRIFEILFDRHAPFAAVFGDPEGTEQSLLLRSKIGSQPVRAPGDATT
jgi:hypothetical protein